MAKSLKRRMKEFLKAYGAHRRRSQRGTDLQKWEDPAELSASWDFRTRQMAALVPPGTHVLEFGAGRMVLKDCLPAGCRYTPSDLVDRGNGTIVCDLNAPELPDFPQHEVTMFCGVLEYVKDVPRLIGHVAKFTWMIIASYSVKDFAPSRISRRANGWINDYTSADFQTLFQEFGFRCDRIEECLTQRVYRFVRQ